MSILAIEANALIRRRDQIRTHLRQVARNPDLLNVTGQKLRNGGHIIAASSTTDATASPTDRLFKTQLCPLYGQYYEIWTPDRDSRHFHPEQIFFHLYSLPDRDKRDQIFCLHAEPQKSLVDHAGRVKASPHIHVKSKEDRLNRIAKSHFPFYYSTAETVLETLEAFDTAWSAAIEIVRREVIERFR